MATNIGSLLKHDSLVKLIQEENFVGWVYRIDYDSASVLTNDLWKEKARGVPHNSFLVAASFNPNQYQNVSDIDKFVVLLRVVSSVPTPQENDLVRTKVDYYQRQDDVYSPMQIDDLTLNQLQFGGLECRVVGTFFSRDGELWLGSDLESFEAANRLNVYRPRGEALEAIVNHIDPIRRRKAEQDAKALGLDKPIDPFPIGSVRYTSTDRLHRQIGEPSVPVRIQPSDFLARRTAVLGMTRTGKSNMVKQTVAVVKQVAARSNVPIGQIIYDINGEYANANDLDQGSLAEVFPNDSIRYRMVTTSGFEELLNNFYIQLSEGFQIIRESIREHGQHTQADVGQFLELSFDEPDPKDRRLHTRWEVQCAAYCALLYTAGFEAPQNFRVKFSANQQVQALVNQNQPTAFPDTRITGLTLQQAKEWFTRARSIYDQLQSSSGNPWIDSATMVLLNMMTSQNSKGNYINGYRVLAEARKYHSPRRTHEVTHEIYQHLVNGKIVILDLSVGNATLRERLSKQVAAEIFLRSMNEFIEGRTPPNIVVYVEEAHNLLGKDMSLTDTWPRLAKEGAKYRIGLVYATQEVSSVHPNILANTENWFVTHLNNEREVRELARFYDFADFSRSLLRAQDVGFARVKTLSSPFVIPVQIDRFDPASLSANEK